jgi:sec-independent protein translocase protein TatC
MSYLYEIKFRCYYIFIYFLFTWFCSYFFCNQIIYILTLPLKKVYLENNPNAIFHLIFTELTEIFFSQTKLATHITFIFLMPMIFYQIWLFLKPGLYKFEKNVFWLFVFLSFFLTFLSLIFTYFVILPSACHFFLSFETIKGFNIYLEAKMDKYLSFILNLFLLCYLIFQIPIFCFFFFNLYFLKNDLLKQTFFPFQIFLIFRKRRKLVSLLSFFILFFCFNTILFSDLSYIILFFFIPIFYEFSLFFILLQFQFQKFRIRNAISNKSIQKMKPN